MIMTETRLRQATAADFPMIRQITALPGNDAYIGDDDEAGLQAYLDSSDSRLLIWEESDRAIGFAIFCELTNPANRTELRRLGLLEIGGGRGLRFLQDLLAYGFETLNRNRIWLDVVTHNTRAQKIYEALGFTKEGHFRAHWKPPAGAVADVYYYGMLKAEWIAQRQG